MYILLYFTLFLFTGTTGDTVEVHNLTVNQIADTLVSVLGADRDNGRIKELEDKLTKVNTYVIENNKIEELLKNVTLKTELNETNFYQALTENDHFRFLTVNDTKNLYLQLKEKMNRDDIMSILSERGGETVLSKSARKAMGEDYSENNDGNPLNDMVDKLIAEEPHDDHKYDVKKNESIFWDPQTELEDLKEYHKHDGRRIYKGERTTIRYYPFMVSIHVMGQFWCGGVLYWHDLVLTSASCLQLMHNNRFFRENPRVLQVRIGSNHSRIGGESVDALEVYFHPAYNPRTLKNNIAVIRLRSHIYLNYHRVPKLISISHYEHSIPPTAEVMLLGWGVTKMTQKLSFEPIFLQRKFLPIYPNKFCKEVYGDKFISSTMFCAGTFTTGEGACDHDAGGPAILSGRLVGIISFGPSICGYANTPTVFTTVGVFADWIETINETMPGYYRGLARTTPSTQSPFRDYISSLQNTHGEMSTTHPTPTVSTTQKSTPSPTTSEPTVTTPPSLRAEGGKEDSDGGWSIDVK